MVRWGRVIVDNGNKGFVVESPEYLGTRDPKDLFVLFNTKESFDLKYLPWGDSKFDVFIPLLSSPIHFDSFRPILKSVLLKNCDWVETFGADSEEWHDRIDSLSVTIGRQQKVGDGSPMTAWHEELIAIDDCIEYILDGGHGYTYNKLVIPFGDLDQIMRFYRLFKASFSSI